MKAKNLLGLLCLTVGLGTIIHNLNGKSKSEETRMPASSAKQKSEIPDAPNSTEDHSQTKSPAKLAASAPLASLSTREDLEQTLKNINDCYQKETCGYNNADPREYEIEVGKDLKRHLERLTRYVIDHRVQDDGISKIAREFLANSDGFVKKAALDLMATQPPSPENLQSILHDALASYDSNLTGQSLMELQKYQSDSDAAQINALIAEILDTGSFRVKLKLAELIETHLNSRNLGHFENVIHRLPADSPVRIHLQAAVMEFKNRHSGG